MNSNTQPSKPDNSFPVSSDVLKAELLNIEVFQNVRPYWHVDICGVYYRGW
jgi:hypothetical protein